MILYIIYTSRSHNILQRDSNSIFFFVFKFPASFPCKSVHRFADHYNTAGTIYLNRLDGNNKNKYWRYIIMLKRNRLEFFTLNFTNARVILLYSSIYIYVHTIKNIRKKNHITQC